MELCSYCQGHGWMPNADLETVACHKCKGRGWVSLVTSDAIDNAEIVIQSAMESAVEAFEYATGRRA